MFADESSPQFKGLAWLANTDASKVNKNDQARLEARFALAMLYFATQGEGWFGDLQFSTNFHECNWTSSAEARQGLACNVDDEVISIIIGKQDMTDASSCVVVGRC
mgnify:CR=1 FL=1